MSEQHIGERPAFTGPVLDTTELPLAVAGTNTLQRGTALQFKSYIGGGTAAGTSFSPAGNITASDVQAAVVELDSKKAPYKSGVVTASSPVLDLSQTFNNAAVTFAGYRFGIVDTASAAASLHTDFHVNGTSLVSFSKTGIVSFSGGIPNSRVEIRGGDTTNSLLFFVAGSVCTRVSGGTIQFGTPGTPNDTIWVRDAAATMAQRNGTAAQTLRVYNTYTSLANRENFAVSWASNTCTVGTETNGATLRPLVISGATISASAPFFPKQYTTATRPAWVNGAQIFDTDIDKLVVGGASGWEVVTSA